MWMAAPSTLELHLRATFVIPARYVLVRPVLSRGDTMADSMRFGQQEWQLAYRAALKVLKSPDQAEDAAQEALIQAYRARNSFRGHGHPHTWLYRIARNTALSQLRRPFTRRYAPVDVHQLIDDRAQNDDRSQSPERDAMAGQLATCVTGCLDGLNAKDRIAFTERFILGTSERELGEILGVTTNAAKQRAFRARRQVRGCVAAAGLN